MFETLFEQDKREYELPLYIQPLSIQDRGWITTLLRNNWGTELIITRGKLHRAIDYPGFIAYQNKNKVGLVIYHIAGDECELVSLNSLREGIGVGGALVEAVKKKALLSGCKRLWLITTNDNLKAMAFYQKRGFRLVVVYPDAIRESRRIKPEIPEIGSHNIPIRDEIELEILLEKI
ncbi:MAG: GNAT family N-acetyltransferase [Candidatus Cloacimonetes bacterium]|nr:GNAT family N-acetyltransferase [Candidatus Cloacimonadota bacterium]